MVYIHSSGVGKQNDAMMSIKQPSSQPSSQPLEAFLCTYAMMVMVMGRPVLFRTAELAAHAHVNGSKSGDEINHRQGCSLPLSPIHPE